MIDTQQAQIQNMKMVEGILQQVRIAKNIRLPWENHWHEIMNYVNPFDDNVDRNSIIPSSAYSSPSTQRGSEKYKSALGALVRNAATILTSQLLDPSVKWFALEINKPNLKAYNEKPVVKEWRRSIEDYIYWLCGNPKSNFYTSSQSFIWEWFTLGTACRYIHMDNQGDLKFDCIPMIQVAHNVNGSGEMDFIVRDMLLSGQQAMGLWGPNAVDNPNMDALTLATQKKKYLHVVMRNPWMMHPADIPLAGFVIDEARKIIVNQEWYYEFPYVISRFFQNSGELYGTSSLWNLLPEIKYMDHMVNMSRYAAEYAIMPPLKVTNGLTIPQTGIMPGARIIGGLDPMGRSNLEPLMLGSGVNISNQIFEMKRQDINQGLIVQDLFVPDDPNRTATQVNEMRAQQDNKIKPIITRWEREDISRTIKFVLQHTARGLLEFPYLEAGINPEDMPDPIEQLAVKYTGVLGRQQARYDSSILNSLLQDAASLSQMPEYVSEVVKLDEVLRFRAETYDLPNNILRSREETDAIREQKAQAQQEQMEQMGQQQALENQIRMIELMKQSREIGGL